MNRNVANVFLWAMYGIPNFLGATLNSFAVIFAVIYSTIIQSSYNVAMVLGMICMFKISPGDSLS